MASERVRRGVQAGIVAWAATLGVLVGFGRSRGAALQPLNSIAHPFFGTRALLMQGFDWAITPAALLLHLAVFVALGVIFALIAARLRGLRLVGAAVAYALLIWLVNRLMLPMVFSSGLVQLLSPWEMGVFYLVMALALALGIRFGVGRAAEATAGA
ncbi:MAG TPA: hypothetical protein VFK04_21485 [Gemmatimonadaceae bacterium]|nr:hypothetical protein [Gemmatimonadaceae bacterium]